MAEQEKKIMQVFEMTADSALKFFEVVQELKKIGIEDTEELRQSILQVMAQEGYISRSYTTKRSKEEFVKDLKDKGFKIDDRTS